MKETLVKALGLTIPPEGSAGRTAGFNKIAMAFRRFARPFQARGQHER